MKMKTIIFLSTLVSTALLFGSETTTTTMPPMDTLSEALGHLIVKNLTHPGLHFNLDKVIQGIRDEGSGKPSPLNEEEYERAIALVQEQLFLNLAEDNLSKATAFLESNAAQEGVISVDPKLQYRIETRGNGKSVEADSVPLIHYTGTLIDGTVFATSHDSGTPISLPIKQSIPGFGKGLVGMKEGEKRVLYIHPELAYGVSGQLPPNSLLIFEVEVLQANTQTAQID